MTESCELHEAGTGPCRCTHDQISAWSARRAAYQSMKRKIDGVRERLDQATRTEESG